MGTTRQAGHYPRGPLHVPAARRSTDTPTYSTVAGVGRARAATACRSHTSRALTNQAAPARARHAHHQSGACRGLASHLSAPAPHPRTTRYRPCRSTVSRLASTRGAVEGAPARRAASCTAARSGVEGCLRARSAFLASVRCRARRRSNSARASISSSSLRLAACSRSARCRGVGALLP